MALLGVVTLSAVFGADLPPGGRAIIAVGVLTVGIASAYRTILAPESRVVRVVADGAGRWILHTAIGGRCRAHLVRGWLAGRAAGLQWRGVDGRWYIAWLVAARDDRDAWRRLRVRLRNPIDEALS